MQRMRLMRRITRMSVWRRAAAALLVLAIAGCAAPPSTRVDEANTAYRRGDYQRAYALASPSASSSSASGTAAAYVAGLSAQKLGRLDTAARYLGRATRSPDDALAADALASLGLLEHSRGRYAQAAQHLERAARRLTGEQRARAYFYAGISHQKLDRWAQARTALVLARQATSSNTMRRRIEQRLAVTGYTVQVGAFGDRDNAQRLAQQLAPKAQRAGAGAPRLVRSTDSRGRPLTLVQVGRFSSFDTARRTRQQLGISDAVVVPIRAR